MRLFEYEGKELFSKYGIPVPRSKLAESPDEAVSVALELGLPAVIKAQVLAGGRGKAGGVVVVRTREEAEREARRVLALRVGGEPTRALLVEELSDHIEEMYLSVSLDRSGREFVAVASRSGGTEVESKAVAGATAKAPIPLDGLTRDAAGELVSRLGLRGTLSSEFCSIILKLERLSREEECELAEINPLAVHVDGTLVALDSKVVLDDNALFRHPELSQFPPEDPLEEQAAKLGFAFVRLDGEVAVLGNGAGLVLSTLDLVADAGARAACFLDLGGGAQRERVEAALRLVRGLGAKAILINIFGGITETGDIAEGVRDVLSEGQLPPVFVRLRGAQEEEARRVLKDAGVPVFIDTSDAVEAAVRGSRL